MSPTNQARGGGRNNRGRGRGRGGRFPDGHGNPRQGSNGPRPICQVCGKPGHEALHCYHRFDHTYQSEENHVAATVTDSYSVDPNWYVDTRAMDHITNDLKRLTTKDPMVVLIKSKSQMGRLVNYLYWKFLSCWIYQTFISEKYSPCSKN